MLRALDPMDRDYAKPLDIPTLARIAIVSEAHFIRVPKDTFGRRHSVPSRISSSLLDIDSGV